MTVQDKGGLPRGLINGLAPPYSLYTCMPACVTCTKITQYHFGAKRLKNRPITVIGELRAYDGATD